MPPDPTPDQRDRHLRVVRRLRIGVVSAGVVGSLGVAGVAGTAAAAPTATSQAASGESSSPAAVNGLDAPRLHQGYGASQASSGGS